MNKAS